MDIEKKMVCRNCGKELKKFSVHVMAQINVMRDEKKQSYEPHEGNFDLDQINKFACPKCNIENEIDSGEQPINSNEQQGKHVLTSFFRKLLPYIQMKSEN